MRRLIESARIQRHRVAAVVYGLVNFDTYFKGREITERLRARDPARYPHLETTYKYFTSFRPVYRSNLIRLTAMVNEQLRAMVSELGRDLANNVNVQVRYSDALATADLSRAELLHPVDGWHASVEGHNVLAEAAFSDLQPSLEFLGIKSSPSDSRN
jgi:lysophospholipase L1-like esterase